MKIRQYEYPKAQEAKFGSFFIMAKVFDSGKYDEYLITEKNTNKTYFFKHETIQQHLQKNPNDRDSRINFAQGEQFIRLRIILAK